MSPPDSSLYSPYFTPSTSSETADESPAVQQIISSLSLLSHPEGGRYVETDRDARIVPNPFLGKAMVGGGKIDGAGSAVGDETEKDETRNASTTIYYHLSPLSNYGSFHRNAGRTVHTVHKGRGRYVIIHADEAEESENGNVRVETFVVGHDLSKGEKLQWIVEGGKFKSSFLLPDIEGGETSSEGLLISETVIPGFDFADHDFMLPSTLDRLVSKEERAELGWMLKKD